MTTPSQPRSQMDPWSTGTPAFRAALVTGMGGTLLGIVLVVLAAVAVPDSAAPTLRTAGLICLGAGLLSHVIGIGLRKRQAARIIRSRRDRS